MNDLTLGDVSVTRLEEMHGDVGMTTQQLFPGSTEEEWQEQEGLLVPDHLNPDGDLVLFATQTWLLRSAGRTILVDTGVGNDKARPAVPVWDHLRLDYLDTLERAGVAPEDVDTVINTHLHVDHVGWNTRLSDGTWVPTFPNATYVMPRADFDFFDPAKNAHITPVNENVFEDSVAPVQASGQVQLWEDSVVIDENLRLEAAPGHTPGSSVVTLDSGSDVALFAGDLLHSPLQVRQVDQNSCFCEDAATARATRRAMLEWAAERGALVLPAHVGGHGAFEVQRSGGGFSISAWAPFDKL